MSQENQNNGYFFSAGVRTIVSTISLIWTAAMIYGSLHAKPSAVEVAKLMEDPGDFGTRVFVGALAWLSLIIDKGGALNIFTGVSMLLGPIWGIYVLKDFNKSVGAIIILICGFCASYVITGGPFNLSYVIGGIVAPFLTAMFILGWAMQSAKEETQKSLGIETDTERRARREREERRREDARRRAG